MSAAAQVVVEVALVVMVVLLVVKILVGEAAAVAVSLRFMEAPFIGGAAGRESGSG